MTSSILGFRKFISAAIDEAQRLLYFVIFSVALTASIEVLVHSLGLHPFHGKDPNSLEMMLQGIGMILSWDYLHRYSPRDSFLTLL